MKLSNISAVAFKGRTFSYPLTGVTHFHGRNRVGKTAVFDAAVVALCGKLPGVGVNGKQLHEALASGDTMSVKATTADDGCIGRAYIAKTDKEGNITVKASCATVRLPEDWVAPTVMFAPSEFLELSDRERTNYLFRVLPPPPMDEFGPVALKAKLKNFKAEPHTEAHEQTIDKLCQHIDGSYNESQGDGFLMQDWLSSLSGEVRENANLATQQAKRMQATAAGVVELKKAGVPQGQAEGDKARAQRALDAANEARTKVAEQWQAANRELKAATATAQSYVAPDPGAKAQAHEDVANWKTALEQPLPLALEPVPGLADATRKLEDAQAEVIRLAKEAAEFHDDAPGVESTSRRTFQQATDALSKANYEAQVARNNVETIKGDRAKFDAATCCPTCRADGTGWKQRVLDELDAKLKSLTAIMDGALVVVTKAKKSHEVAANKLQCVLERLGKKAINTSSTAAAKLAEANAVTCIERLKQQRQNELVLLRSHQQSERDKSISRLKTITDAEAKAEPARLARESLPQLQATLAEIEDNAKPFCKERIAELQTAVTAADTVLRQCIAEAATAKQVKAAGEAYDKALAEATVTKHLSELLNETLAACVEKSVAPLLDAANELFKGVLDDPLVWYEGVIGMHEKGGHFYSWRTFSGSERAIAFAAIGCALAAASGYRLAIIDELSRLDDTTKARLLERLCGLVTVGKLDQAIVVDVRPAPELGGYFSTNPATPTNPIFTSIEVLP